MPDFSGYYTQHGRPIYYDDQGEAYSERSITIQGEDGKWYNVPTVLAQGEVMPGDEVEQFYRDNGMIDPVTGKPIPSFPSVQAAERDAATRSSQMQWIEQSQMGGNPDG